MSLINILEGSWSLYRFKYQEDTIVSALGRIKNINWTLFLLYSYIFYLFANIVRVLETKSFSDFFQLSTFSHFFLVKSLSFLGIYILILLGFYFTNLFFKADIKFSDFYKAFIYIQLPLNVMFLAMFLFSFIPYINKISTII